MPKSFIYSVRNYDNRKAVEDEEDSMSGPVFPSGILTRSGKVTDQNGNAVPGKLGDLYHQYYHHYYQHHIHSSVVKGRGGHSNNGSNNKERERKRKTKAKPKSLHHLSLVTRFQLGLRMSRLRSRQRSPWPFIGGGCREPDVNNRQQGETEGRGCYEKDKIGIDKKPLQKNNQDQYTPIVPGEIDGVEDKQIDEMKTPIANTDETRIHVSQSDEEVHMERDIIPGDKDLPVERTDNTLSSINKEDNSIDNSVSRIVEDQHNSCNNISQTGLVHSNHSISSCTKNGGDAESKLTPRTENRLDIDHSSSDAMSKDDAKPTFCTLQSKYVDGQRPKVVITLPKSCSHNRQRGMHTDSSNGKDIPSLVRSTVTLSSNDIIHDTRKTELTSTIDNNKDSQPLNPRPSQLVDTQTATIHSYMTTVLSGESIVDGRTETVYEDLKTNLDEHEALTKSPFRVGSNSEEPSVNVKQISNGKIFIVVKSNAKDEADRKKLRFADIPSQSFSDNFGYENDNENLNYMDLFSAESAERNIQYHGTNMELMQKANVNVVTPKREINANCETVETAQPNSTEERENIPPKELTQGIFISDSKKIIWNQNLKTITNYALTRKLSDNSKEFTSDEIYNCKASHQTQLNGTKIPLEIIQVEHEPTPGVIQSGGSRYDLGDEFQRISAVYSQEVASECNETTNPLTQASREKTVAGELHDILRNSTQSNNVNLTRTSIVQQCQPFLYNSASEGSFQQVTDSLTLKRISSTSHSANPVFNQPLASKQSYNVYDKTEEPQYQTNQRQIVLVPTSNVLTIPPVDMQQNTTSQYSRIIVRESAKVTWSDRQLRLPQYNHHHHQQQQQHQHQQQHVNNALSNITTTYAPLQNIKDGRLPFESNASTNTPIPLRDISNNFINIPFECKLPIRKEETTVDESGKPATVAKCINQIQKSDDSSRQQTEHKPLPHNSRSKTVPRNGMMHNIPTTYSPAEVTNSNSMAFPAVHSTGNNCIGSLPVNLPQSNNRFQKPILLVPTTGVNFNTVNDEPMTHDSERTKKTISMHQSTSDSTSSHPVVHTYFPNQPGSEKSSSTVSSLSCLAPHLAGIDQEMTPTFRPVESTGNNTQSSSLVTGQSPWLPLVKTTDTTRNTNKTAMSDFQRKPFSFPNKPLERKMTMGENQDMMHFATPAADLLSSVAKVPNHSIERNYNSGTPVRNENAMFTSKFKTNDFPISKVQLAIAAGTTASATTMLKDFASQNANYLNKCSDHNLGQFVSSDKHDDASELFMSKRGQKREWLETGNVTAIDSVNQILIDNNCKVQKQEYENIFSAKTPKATTSPLHPQLLLIRDQSNLARMSIGVISPTSNITSISALQAFNNPRYCEAGATLMSSEDKTEEITRRSSVSSMHQTTYGNNRPGEIYIANPFVANPFVNGQLNSITNQMNTTSMSVQGTEPEIGKITNLEAGCVTERFKTDEIENFIDFKNRLGGQTVYIKNGVLKNHSLEDMKGEMVASSLVTNLAASSASTQIAQTFKQGEIQTGSHGGLSSISRYDTGLETSMRLDLPSQMSSVPTSSISTLLKPYNHSMRQSGINNDKIGSRSNTTGSHSNSNNNNSNIFNINHNNVCPICHRRFTRPWLLKGHMRTHTGERPFVCSFPKCEKAFADKSNLRSHMQTHTTVTKNFECGRCGRAFSQKRYLHKHITEVCKYGNK